jgi:hypothetical protein
MPTTSYLSKVAHDESLGLLTVLTIWAIIQLAAYLVFGIHSPVDTVLYVVNADLLLAGVLPQGQEFFYLSYVSLLALLKFFTVDPGKIVIFQIIVSGAAVYSIYKITQAISSSNLVAFTASLLFVFWFKFQQWNLILYTDALFANLVVVLIYLVYRARSRLQFTLLIPAIAFVVLLRPTGIVLLIALISYFAFEILNFRKMKLAVKAFSLVLTFVVSMVLLNLYLADFVDSFLHSYQRAEIIYPNITLGVERPMNLVLPSEQALPLVKLFTFILSNPLYMIKISLYKIILFLGHVKPYYSVFHNLVIVSFLFPIYFFAIKGYNKMPKDGLRVFMLTLISLQVLMVGVTSENWDGRFILTILPWIFVISAFGIASFVTKANQKIKATQK